MDVTTIQRALVVGMGYRTGLATCNFLAGRGVAVTGSDAKPAADLAEVLAKLNPAVEVVAGGQDPVILDRGFDLLVLSPGVPRVIPLVAEAERRGIPVMAEVELAWRFLKGATIGITGTDGKSTTTALTGHLLAALGWDALVGGNIGIPLVSFVGRDSEQSVIVAELSSFQLETIEAFRPRVAAMLNISPDHLDRYPDMEAYAAAKWRITANQTDGDVFVYNADDARVAAGVDRVRARVRSFSLADPSASAAYRDGAVYLNRGGVAVKAFERERMRILGLHNVQNAMAALLMVEGLCDISGRPFDAAAFAEALYTFPGLEHRLERVGTFRGRLFINDSKATTVAAVERAIESVPGKTVLILGGRTKGDDYSRLAASFAGRVRALVLIGEAAPVFAELFKDFRAVRAGSLDDAVARALEYSEEGDTVLLSPACASFDMFRSYEHRGEEFRRAVKSLAGEGLSWT